MKTRKSVKTKDTMCPSQRDIRFLESQLIKEVQTGVTVYYAKREARNAKRETQQFPRGFLTWT